jgi:hypothetical protein
MSVNWFIFIVLVSILSVYVYYSLYKVYRMIRPRHKEPEDYYWDSWSSEEKNDA